VLNFLKNILSLKLESFVLTMRTNAIRNSHSKEGKWPKGVLRGKFQIHDEDEVIDCCNILERLSASWEDSSHDEEACQERNPTEEDVVHEVTAMERETFQRNPTTEEIALKLTAAIEDPTEDDEEDGSDAVRKLTVMERVLNERGRRTPKPAMGNTSTVIRCPRIRFLPSGDGSSVGSTVNSRSYGTSVVRDDDSSSSRTTGTTGTEETYEDNDMPMTPADFLYALREFIGLERKPSDLSSIPSVFSGCSDDEIMTKIPWNKSRQASAPKSTSFSSRASVPKTTSFSSRASVPKTSSFSSRASVPKTTSFSSRASVPKTTSFSSRASVPKTTSFSSRASVPKTTSFSSRASVPKTTSFSSRASVPKATSFSSRASVPKTTSFSSQVSVPKATSFSSRASVPKTTSFSSQVSVPKAPVFSSRASVRKATSFSSRASVQKNTSFSSREPVQLDDEKIGSNGASGTSAPAVRRYSLFLTRKRKDDDEKSSVGVGIPITELDKFKDTSKDLTDQDTLTDQDVGVEGILDLDLTRTNTDQKRERCGLMDSRCEVNIGTERTGVKGHVLSKCKAEYEELQKKYDKVIRELAFGLLKRIRQHQLKGKAKQGKGSTTEGTGGFWARFRSHLRRKKGLETRQQSNDSMGQPVKVQGSKSTQRTSRRG